MSQGRNINAITLKELFKENTDGSFPILIDIVHEDIVWSDDNPNYSQGHLRLINAETPVKYQNNYYLPSHFEFTPPQEDGVKVSNTTITISAIDKRVVEIIRNIRSNPKAVIEAFYFKIESEGELPLYKFSKAYKYEFLMAACNWDSITAQWTLVFDPVMQVNVPKDTATASRCPSVMDSK